LRTESWFELLLSTAKRQATHTEKTKGGNMKKLVILVVLAMSVPAPSFGADIIGHSADIVGHSAKVAGKDSYKAAKTSAKDTAKAGKAVVRFLF
jgi:hypothetical protein